MNPEPKGPSEYPLERLSADQFEVLTFLLARDGFPAVVRVRAKDHGLDSRLPDRSGATLRGWQAKRYTGNIAWGECEKSLRRALAFWRPLRVTFTFPKVLTASQQKTFRTRLIEGFPEMRIDWWDASELTARMRETEGGQRAADWLFSNPEADKEALKRALAVGGELEDAGDVARRIAEVQGFVDRDPHLLYTIVSADQDAPPTPTGAQTIASLEAKIGGKRIRFDASERYHGAAADAGLGGKLIFSDDEDGRRAREAIARLEREGGSVEISSGMAAEFGTVPVGLRGLAPEGLTEGKFQVSVTEPIGTPAPEAGLSVLLRAGEEELGLVLNPVDPPEGWAGAIAGSTGGLEVLLSIGARPGEPMRLDWRWRRGEGNALEQLLAARVMLAAHVGSRIELVAPEDGRVVAEMSFGEVEELEEQITEIEQIAQYLGFVSELEAWLGEPLFPPAIPSDKDVEELGLALGQIRNPESAGTWTRIELTMSKPTELEVFQVALVEPVYTDLFGERRYLGGRLVRIPEARLEPGSEAAREGDLIAIVPAGDDSLTILLQPPDEAPERALAPKAPDSADENAP